MYDTSVPQYHNVAPFPIVRPAAKVCGDHTVVFRSRGQLYHHILEPCGAASWAPRDRQDLTLQGTCSEAQCTSITEVNYHYVHIHWITHS